MTKKINTNLPSFKDFITILQNNYNNPYNINPEIITNISITLEEKAKNHYILAIDNNPWETIKESKNTVTIHITDDMATTIIPVYAFIITPKNTYDKMILKSIKIQQGTNYNNDLDEIYATYTKRNNLTNLSTEIEQVYIKEISKYKTLKN